MRKLVGAAISVLVLSVQLSAQGDPMKPMTFDPPKQHGAAARAPRPFQMEDADIDRVQTWLAAIADHVPGESDAAAVTVGSWPLMDLRTLWINTTTLLTLMHDASSGTVNKIVKLVLSLTKPLKTPTFTIKVEGRPATDIRYTAEQLLRLNRMACAAAGVVVCVDDVQPPVRPDGSLARLSGLAAANRRSGNENFVLRRGAMLHTDIAVFHAGANPEPLVPRALPAPKQVRINLFDGRETTRGEIAIHWVIGRLLLDAVAPAGHTKPAPADDEMVRRWYQATGAWMQLVGSYDTTHLAHGGELFPRDPDILFLRGCEREAFASARVQAAVAMPVPAGFRFPIESEREELHRAEMFFRGALQARPAMAEARVHLGRVLLLEGAFAEAAEQLRAAAPLADDPLQYYRSLFLGLADERLMNFADASQAYGRANELYPEAQSPLIGLIEVDWRLGDRAAATRDLGRLFALPADTPTPRDPWWIYYSSPGRGAGALLDELRRLTRHSST